MLPNGNIFARFQRASVQGGDDPGYRFAQPGANLLAALLGLLVCTPQGVKEICPGERSVASHRGLVNPGGTRAVGVRGEIGGSAAARPAGTMAASEFSYRNCEIILAVVNFSRLDSAALHRIASAALQVFQDGGVHHGGQKAFSVRIGVCVHDE